jgi:hypothetical protein
VRSVKTAGIDRARAFEAGFQLFIAKPIEPVEILVDGVQGRQRCAAGLTQSKGVRLPSTARCPKAVASRPRHPGRSVVRRIVYDGGQPSERLIGILSSEIDKSLSQWTDRHRNDLASQLGLFAKSR